MLVRADSNVTVPYTVRVPANAKTEDHTFVVLTSRLDVENPYDPFSVEGATLTLTLSNSGNIRVVPAASVNPVYLLGR